MVAIRLQIWVAWWVVEGANEATSSVGFADTFPSRGMQNAGYACK